MKKLKCECGGALISTGIAKLSYPPQYEYRCDKCDKFHYKN